MQHRIINYLSLIVFAFIVLTTASPLQAVETATQVNGGTADKGTVATVNGTAISQDQFDNALAYQEDIAALNGVTITDDQMSELKYNVLANLINTELLYQASRNAGVKIEDKEVSETFESQKQKARFETDAEFEEALKKSNKTIASYKEEIKEGLAIDRFIKARFTDSITVPDSEAKAYYDANPDYFKQAAGVRVSHIMVSVAENADQATKDAAFKKITLAKERLKAGEDFAALAKEVSDDTNSRDDGGDLGFFSKGQTPQSFEDAAFSMKKGETSDIITTDSGYHILRLTDKKDAGIVSYEDVKDDIIESMKSSKVNSAVSSYLIVLKNKATIVTYPVDK